MKSYLAFFLSLMVIGFSSGCRAEDGIETTTLDGTGEGCQQPKLSLKGSSVDVRPTIKTDYYALNEIKFVAQMPTPNDKQKGRLCKIKCIDDEWVGPLCQDFEKNDVHYHPILKGCSINLRDTLLVMLFEDELYYGWQGHLPDRTTVSVHCDGRPGDFMLDGNPKLTCFNGEWDNQLPTCYATSYYSSFDRDAPPTIKFKLTSGTFDVDLHQYEYVVYPGAVAHIECIWKKEYGNPFLNSTSSQKLPSQGWSAVPGENIYRLSIFYLKEEHSGEYFCTSPRGNANSITIRVAAIQCPERNAVEKEHLILKSQSNHVGGMNLYSCPKGYNLIGHDQVLCMHTGQWATDIPSCEPVYCPVFEIEDPHLMASGLTTTYGGELFFTCPIGYQLNGTNRVYCNEYGNWSDAIPTCEEVLCVTPTYPANMILIEKSSKGHYRVGTVIQFGCYPGHYIDGDSTVFCKENGIWSSEFPKCKAACKVKEQMEHGNVVPLKFEYEPGDKIKVVCDPGFVVPEVFIECNSTGFWSMDIPRCIHYTLI